MHMDLSLVQDKGVKFMLKQTLLSIFGALLIILGMFYAIFAPWLGFLAANAVVLGLLVILFSMFSRRDFCYRRCFLVNCIIGLLGVGIIFTGSFMIWIWIPLFFIGALVVLFGFIIFALAILLIAEC